MLHKEYPLRRNSTNAYGIGIWSFASHSANFSRHYGFAVRPVSATQHAVRVTSVNLDKTLASQFVGYSFILSADILPADASDRTLTWSSSDENIATVNQNGVVTTKSLGAVTITAKANDGSGLSSSCEVRVVSAGDVNGDGIVNVSDVSALIDLLLKGGNR